MQKQFSLLVGLLLSLVLVASWAKSAQVAEAQPSVIPTRSTTSVEQMQQVLQSSPLMFIENVGQFAEDVRFQVRGGDRTIWLTEDAIWITLLEPVAVAAPPKLSDHPWPDSQAQVDNHQGVHVRLSFPGANVTATLEPFDPLTTTLSYFIGDDPDGWWPAVPVWGGVRYLHLYPGLDLEISGPDRMQLRLVCRLADCNSILANLTIRVEGAEDARADEAGLLVNTAVGDFIMPWLEVVDNRGQPLDTDDAKPVVNSNLVERPYTVQNAIRTSESVTIHQTGNGLLYGTFLGGVDTDWAGNIALDNNGRAVITGWTSSLDFPTTYGAFGVAQSGNNDDVFIARFAADGSTLDYIALLGGGGDDAGLGLSLSAEGHAIITGGTASTNFPTTPGAFDTNHNGFEDAFVAQLSPLGSELVYATYLGGSAWDYGHDLIVNVDGSTTVVGITYSINFPTTPGAFDTSYNSNAGLPGDAFVVQLNPNGSNLIYSTYLGGTDSDQARSVALDTTGNATILGYTSSTDFPTVLNAFDISYNGGSSDVFVARLNSNGSSLLYGTYLGGSGEDRGMSLGLAANGHTILTGLTSSIDFPITLGAFDTSYGGGSNDAFVARLSLNDSNLVYSTFLGGSGSDIARDIAVAEDGSVAITGSTVSTDFPTTPNSFDTGYNGGSYDAFVARLDSGGSNLLYGAFLGGSSGTYGGGDSGQAIAVDTAGIATIFGYTYSTDFPTTIGAFDTTHNGFGDAFVAQMTLDVSGGCSIPYFSQRDPAWIDHPLRTNGDCSANCSTIGSCGCTLTAATMLFAYYGADLTPPELSDCMWTQACPFSWGTGASCSQGRATFVDKYAFSWALLDQQLNQFNRPVMLEMYEDNDSNKPHWVLVVSGQGDDPANYIMHDPWPVAGEITTLSARLRDNWYTPKSIAIYEGVPTCSLASVQGMTRTAIQPTPIYNSVERDRGESNAQAGGSNVRPSQEVTGTVWLYHMTELTMTVQLTATSSFGEITEMQVWTDANPNPVWQPFSEYGWLEWFPEHDVIYARFRDELGNESGLANDTTHPVYSPPPESAFQQLWLPILLKPQ